MFGDGADEKRECGCEGEGAAAAAERGWLAGFVVSMQNGVVGHGRWEMDGL